ncbi:S8 family peptidase [Patescibacteria group bacterium]|nr:S8 family peptidase [Patescibacteria group bacterium]
MALFFLSIFSFSTSTFASHEKISTELLSESKHEPTSNIPVIIQTKKGLQERQKSKVQNSGGKLKHDLKLIKSFSADLPASAIKDLAKDNDVTKISYDTEVHATLDTAVFSINAPAAWDAGFTGKGVTVAVIDSGIYPHPDLTQPNNRIVAFRDFINKKTLPYDDCGHGTHVAGIIAGNGNQSNGLYRGVAPEANLVGVKVLDNTGSGRTSDVIAGIQWAVDHKATYNIKVVNLSLGASATESYTTDPLSQAAEAAYNAGLVVVTAAGNNGPNSGTINTPGINPNVITVGAVDDKGTEDTSDDVIASFSSRGPTIDGLTKPDILGPGVNITSLSSDVGYLPKENSGSGTKNGKPTKAKAQKKSSQTTMSNYYVTMSGTSTATPMLAGKIALLLEEKPWLMPDMVKLIAMGKF